MNADPNPAPAPQPVPCEGSPAAPAPPEGGSGLPGTDDLSPLEQMARFEEHLKEEDWGHQPC